MKTTKKDYDRLVKSRKAKRAYVEAWKEAGSCLDCGEDNPHILTFIHTRRKKDRYPIDTLTSRGASWSRLVIAIRKCDLVCLNCKKKRQNR